MTMERRERTGLISCLAVCSSILFSAAASAQSLELSPVISPDTSFSVANDHSRDLPQTILPHERLFRDIARIADYETQYEFSDTTFIGIREEFDNDWTIEASLIRRNRELPLYFESQSDISLNLNKELDRGMSLEAGYLKGQKGSMMRKYLGIRFTYVHGAE